uniref:Uncharacterized protein n=1 Tax=Ananas comosus var. bracteatus TaxID=296719 RepID=A0A6V7P206_ANACO|nr:unnamed protein product [Ananas comosus var. bracteatus]
MRTGIDLSLPGTGPGEQSSQDLAKFSLSSLVARTGTGLSHQRQVPESNTCAQRFSAAHHAYGNRYGVWRLPEVDYHTGDQLAGADKNLWPRPFQPCYILAEGGRRWHGGTSDGSE